MTTPITSGALATAGLPMPRDEEVQQVARALSEGVVVICGHCGQPDTRDTAGRRRHQQLYGHQMSGTDNRKEAHRA